MIQRVSAASPILLVPALVPFLRCPDQRCRRWFGKIEPESRYRGALECLRSGCGCRWFAEPLDRGSIRRQLEDALCDPGIANDLMIRFRLPESIDSAMFLQIPLTGELWDGYVKDADRTRSRTRRLIARFLDSLQRRAS